MSRWVFLTVILPVGLIVMLFGEVLINFTKIVTGIALSGLIIFTILYSAFLVNNYKLWLGWFCIATIFLFGSILGIMLTQLPKLGSAVVAFLCGLCAGMALY